MTLRLTLICHGATPANRLGAFPGDDDLTAAARSGMQAVTASRTGRFDRAWTSPAPAAVATAALLGLDATPDPALRELDYGRWTGVTLANVAAHEPEALAAWMSDPEAVPHGGESVAALLARAGAWLAALHHEEGGRPLQRIVAISHATVIRAIMVVALGAPPETFQRIDVGPLSRVVLSGLGTLWRLQTLDNVATPAR